MILGIPGDNTYANMKEARQALWEQTILPLLYKIVSELNNWLVPQFEEGLVLSINEDVIPALAPRREAMWNRLENADFLSYNEKRAAVGYGPAANGDDILVPANMLPLGFTPENAETEKSFAAWLVKENGFTEEKALALAEAAFNVGS
jgi:phage portal protein BeeE